MRPHLTPRLAAVAQWVPHGARLADVGTDHGYLPAWLVLEDRISAAVATDLRPGPLDKARVTMERFGVADRVDLRLCDGLTGVSPEEADVITIAGMGGETILQILDGSPWSTGKLCLVQPMTAAEDLRSGLAQRHICIRRERLVEEGSTLYVVLELVPGDEPLTPAECWVGKAACHEGDPLWERYLDRARRRVSRALEGLSRSARPADRMRRSELEAVRAGLDRMRA